VHYDCFPQFHFQCWPKKCIFSSCVLELRHTTLTYTNLITLPNTYEKGCISFESYRPDRQTHTSDRLLHASAKVVGITTECSREGRHSHYWSVGLQPGQILGSTWIHTLHTYIQRYEVMKSYKKLKLTGTRRTAAISGRGSLLTATTSPRWSRAVASPLARLDYCNVLLRGAADADSDSLSAPGTTWLWFSASVEEAPTPTRCSGHVTPLASIARHVLSGSDKPQGAQPACIPQRPRANSRADTVTVI